MNQKKTTTIRARERSLMQVCPVFALSLLLFLTPGCTATAPVPPPDEAARREPEEPRHRFLSAPDFDYPLMPMSGSPGTQPALSPPEPEPGPVSEPDFYTFAVASLAGRHFDDFPQLEKAVERMLAFHPDKVLVLGALDDPPADSKIDKLKALAAAATDAGPGPRLVAPDQTRALQLLAWNQHAAWLFFNPLMVDQATAGELDKVLDEVSEQLLSRRGERIVLCTGYGQFRTTAKNRKFWYRLRWLLAQNEHKVTVMMGGAPNFSWWREGNLDFYSIPHLTGRLDRRPDLAAGQFNGMLWGHAGAGGHLRLQAVALSGVLEQNEMARSDQQIVEILDAGLTASPFSDARPLTTVTLRNTTEHMLEFSARWQAAGEIEVDPRVVGFTLEPEQVFSQQFRLASASARPLKFLAPVFVLQTEIPGPGGTAREIVLQAVPWGRLAGVAPFMANSMAIDGSLEEWQHDGMQLNHSAQVIAGRDSWGGPADLSAVVRTGYCHDNLYLAVRVVDSSMDHLGTKAVGLRERISLHLLTGPAVRLERSAQAGSYEGGEVPVLSLAADPDGRIRIDGDMSEPALPEVAAAVIETSTGYIAEFAFPKGLFVDDVIPDPLLLDVVIRGFDQIADGQYREKVMQLSGFGPAPELFAIIRLQEPPEPEEEQQND